MKPSNKTPVKTKPFSRLSKRDQRIAIANDILARLKTKQLEPQQKVWVNTDVANTDLRDYLNKGAANTCQCCALGGAICGLASKEDKIETDEYGMVHFHAHEDNDTFTRLSSIFGYNNLVMIEIAYEGGNGACEVIHELDSELMSISKYDKVYDDDGGVIDEALYQEGRKLKAQLGRFYRRYSTSETRFKAIWTNVARNGEFVP